MLFEVDVSAEGNSPMDLNRVFDLLSEPKPIAGLFTANPLGEDIWCRITGWSQAGPCPAYAAMAEDSGDGVILLVYGGDDGIRLSPADEEERWDLGSSQQWGEKAKSMMLPWSSLFPAACCLLPTLPCCRRRSRPTSPDPGSHCPIFRRSRSSVRRR